VTQRCPNCGGLVGQDAQWCGQCLAPLGPPADETPAPSPGVSSERGAARDTAPAAPRVSDRSTARRAGPIRPADGVVVWECPTCQTENPIDAVTCRGCGTPFARLLEEEHRRPEIEPRRAVGLSMLFPGLGHVAAGRGAEGAARAVVFAYALATVVTVLVMRAGEGFGPFLPLLLISAAAGIGLYAVTVLDAGRLARSEDPILSTRALLYGAVGLILLTVVVLLVIGTRVGGRT
jgi:hypothetical protein